ncbi:MAG: helix-turn-helix transcriptional regulator [Bacilli bacterium]|nr:helix-turn-helix transcriptional regulator [Bacilli bacterium]
MKIDIGTKIKEIRQSKGIKQSFIAEKLDMSVASYSSYERGRTELTMQLIARIAEILEVNPILLLENKGTLKDMPNIQYSLIDLNIKNIEKRSESLMTKFTKLGETDMTKLESYIDFLIKEQNNE